MSGVPPIRVIAVDDKSQFQDALAALLADERSLVLVGAAADAQTAIDLAERVRPDVALVDVRMPGGGANAARGILAVSPSTKLIALSALNDRESVFAMLEAGVGSYLVKGSPGREIVDAIKSAHIGGATLSLSVTGAVVDELAGHLVDDARARSQDAGRVARVRHVVESESALHMVFQPVVTLALREVIAVEALARFPETPGQGPDYWFPEAVEVGLGPELELVAVTRALAVLDRLPPNVALSVNASPATLAGHSFRELVEGVPPSRLIVELTEHDRIGDYAQFNTEIASVRAHGVRLAIDDAGAGFASLRHVLKLEPEFIKLDRSLIEGIEQDPATRALVAGLVSFADQNRVTVVAEGIEREGQLDTLVALGVQHGQGYLLGVPHADYRRGVPEF